jgi:hypothetical protein
MSLEGLRVNQLSLARHLQGEVALTPPRLLIKAGGSRPDEALTLDLALQPLAMPGAPVKGPDGRVHPTLYCPPGERQQQGQSSSTISSSSARARAAEEEVAAVQEELQLGAEGEAGQTALPAHFDSAIMSPSSTLACTADGAAGALEADQQVRRGEGGKRDAGEGGGKDASCGPQAGAVSETQGKVGYIWKGMDPYGLIDVTSCSCWHLRSLKVAACSFGTPISLSWVTCHIL